MNDCTTCRWYAYLKTLNVHLCHSPGVGEITEQEFKNTAKYGCDAWEPREGRA